MLGRDPSGCFTKLLSLHHFQDMVLSSRGLPKKSKMLSCYRVLPEMTMFRDKQWEDRQSEENWQADRQVLVPESYKHGSFPQGEEFCLQFLAPVVPTAITATM